MKAPYTVDQLIEELEDFKEQSPRRGMSHVFLGEFPVFSVKLDGNRIVMGYNEQTCKHCGRFDCDPEANTGCSVATELWELEND